LSHLKHVSRPRRLTDGAGDETWIRRPHRPGHGLHHPSRGHRGWCV